MTLPEPDITLDVDLRNPGQFFACCGVLELASRLWPGSAENNWHEPEGWFANGAFHVATNRVNAKANEPPLAQVITWLATEPNLFSRTESDIAYEDKLYPIILQVSWYAGWDDNLPAKHRDTESNSLMLDWWLEKPGATEKSNFKFWAARQHPMQVIKELRAGLALAVNTIDDTDTGWESLFSRKCRMSTRFGLDPFAAWNALDMGFSPNNHSAYKKTQTFPAVELLAAIGLQGFRPQEDGNGHELIYSAWLTPLPVCIARAAAAGLLGGTRFRFAIDSRGRFKAFGYAEKIEKE